MQELSIIPAIIPQSLEHLKNAIEKLLGEEASHTSSPREIQIDIVDGALGGEKSWPYSDDFDKKNREASIAALAGIVPRGLAYEFDLMIQNPLQTLPAWLAQKARSVVLHLESFDTDADIRQALALIHQTNSKAILAALNDTPLERLFAFVPDVDGIQCMGIAEIGRQGNPFDTRVLARIQTIRQIHSKLSISVDGSVNKETIISLKIAGANRFVVGSGIFNSVDPVSAYRELNALVNRK